MLVNCLVLAFSHLYIWQKYVKKNLVVAHACDRSGLPPDFVSLHCNKLILIRFGDDA